ncbi:VUT family protein [Arthrobacter pityocampae]|uniref:VUT family protein n=1 Tax=Arthrobacter pityocampae TaxID=547334 RepID=UPI003736E3CA
MATAGTYFAGLTFVIREAVQDTAGKRWPRAIIVVGAALSLLLADPFIALASAAAFLVFELTNFAVYTPLRKRGYIRATTTSNVLSAFVDAFVFLKIARCPIQDALVGQIIGKLALTAADVVLVALFCAWHNARITQGAALSK